MREKVEERERERERESVSIVKDPFGLKVADNFISVKIIKSNRTILAPFLQFLHLFGTNLNMVKCDKSIHLDERSISFCLQK